VGRRFTTRPAGSSAAARPRPGPAAGAGERELDSTGAGGAPGSSRSRGAGDGAPAGRRRPRTEAAAAVAGPAVSPPPAGRRRPRAGAAGPAGASAAVSTWAAPSERATAPTSSRSVTGAAADSAARPAAASSSSRCRLSSRPSGPRWRTGASPWAARNAARATRCFSTSFQRRALVIGTRSSGSGARRCPVATASCHSAHVRWISGCLRLAPRSRSGRARQNHRLGKSLSRSIATTSAARRRPSEASTTGNASPVRSATSRGFAHTLRATHSKRWANPQNTATSTGSITPALSASISGPPPTTSGTCTEKGCPSFATRPALGAGSDLTPPTCGMVVDA